MSNGADRLWTGKVHGLPRRREPFDAIRVGSVIRWNGHLRTVRAVARAADGTVQVASFVKLTRSGYPSPDTQYWRTDIRRSFGGIVVHRKLPLCATDLECRTQDEIVNGKGGVWATVTEREVVGVIW